MDNVWEKALTFLSSEVNDQIFSRWFLPIKQISINDDSLTLGVPNKFFEDWIKEKYISLLRSAVFQASGKEMNIVFEKTAVATPEDNLEALSDKTPSTQAPTGSGVVDEKSGTMGWLKTMFSGTRQFPESAYQTIGLNPKYSFENFVVGPNNRFAHAAALAITESLAKSYNPLFIYGGTGLGKTHLLQAMGQQILKNFPKAKILYISSEEFTNQLIQAIKTKTTMKFRTMYRNVDVLLLDDAHFIAGKESTQEEFFHTFNTLYDSHKQIVLSSDRSPKEIPDLEERLVSRFDWGLTADIQPPNLETRIAIIEKKCELVSIPVPKDVVYFLAENVRSNIREIEGALIRVVASSKLVGREMSVDLAKEVLKGMLVEESKTITIPAIQKIVSENFDISLVDLKSKKKSHSVAYPRQIAMYLSRKLTDHSFPDIGDAFGGRDHTTVLHAVDKIQKEYTTKENTKSLIDRLVILVKK